MYKSVRKLKDCGGFLYIYKDEVITKIKFDNKKVLVKINDDIETVPYSRLYNDSIFRFVITNNHFIASYQDKGTFFYSKDCSLLNKINETLYLTQKNETDVYIYTKEDDKIYRYNKLNNSIDIFSSEKKLLLDAVFDNYILESNKNHISIKKDNKSSIDLVWQKDFTELLKYQFREKVEIGVIMQVKLYKDSLIVVSDGRIIRLLLTTGEIIWKKNSYGRTIEIVGEIGYVCVGVSLYKINLETGEIYSYGYNNDYNRLPDFEYNNNSYWPIGHEVIYHDDLLWYAVYSSGESFVIAINPYDGFYEWIHHVDTYEKVDSIKFHENKMYLIDTGGDLHIYEKQKK